MQELVSSLMISKRTGSKRQSYGTWERLSNGHVTNTAFQLIYNFYYM